MKYGIYGLSPKIVGGKLSWRSNTLPRLIALLRTCLEISCERTSVRKKRIKLKNKRNKQKNKKSKNNRSVFAYRSNKGFINISTCTWVLLHKAFFRQQCHLIDADMCGRAELPLCQRDAGVSVIAAAVLTHTEATCTCTVAITDASLTYYTFLPEKGEDCIPRSICCNEPFCGNFPNGIS